MSRAARDKRLAILERQAPRAPDPDPLAAELERWAAGLSCHALMRAERLLRTMAADPERGDDPMSEFERKLVECATLDVELGGADPVQRAEARAWLARWIGDPGRAFMRGAEVRGWFGWHGIDIDGLAAGEMMRLGLLLRLFEQHSGEVAGLTGDAIWAVIGDHGRRKGAWLA